MVEEDRDAMAGVDFLTSTRQQWSSSILNGHITWHLALHYLGKMSNKQYREILWEGGGGEKREGEQESVVCGVYVCMCRLCLCVVFEWDLPTALRRVSVSCICV